MNDQIKRALTVSTVRCSNYNYCNEDAIKLERNLKKNLLPLTIPINLLMRLKRSGPRDLQI